MLHNALRSKVAMALAAALLAASMGSPASAPAAPPAQQPARIYCNLYVEPCHTIHLYFSDASHTTQVGRGIFDCEGIWTLEGSSSAYYEQYITSCPPL